MKSAFILASTILIAAIAMIAATENGKRTGLAPGVPAAAPAIATTAPAASGPQASPHQDSVDAAINYSVD